MGRRKKIDTQEVIPTQRKDSWSNALSGIGTNKDKRQFTTFGNAVSITKETLAEMYSDGLAKRIVDCVAEDMTREWCTIKGDENEVIQDAMTSLQIQTHTNIALRWARLFGGSLMVIGAMDGSKLDQPLNENKIRSIEYIKVFDLGSISIESSKFYMNPNNPKYGKIEQYYVTTSVGNQTQSFLVHETRCVPFFGEPVSSLSYTIASTESRYWGSSVLIPCYESLRDYAGAMASVSAILYEFVIGKYKFSDLDELLAQGNEKLFQNRIQAIEMTKSVLKAVIMGTDEEYSRDSANISGVPDVLDRFMMNLSAVSSIPVTKLFGRSAAGLNATGDGDSKNYYDSVRAKQVFNLTPAVTKIMNVIAKWKGIKTELDIVWNSLFQLTEEQEANRERTVAETYRTTSDADDRYLNQGILSKEDIYNLRFKDLLKKPYTELLSKDEKAIESQEEMSEKSSEETPDIDETMPMNKNQGGKNGIGGKGTRNSTRGSKKN
jgi:hypothetical protein